MLAMANRRNMIPRLLERRGMTIWALSKATRIPHHSVKRIVESPEIPGGTWYKTLRELSEALGVSIDDLEEK